MTGYTGSLPLPPAPDGKTRAFHVGERGIAEYRRVIAAINRGEMDTPA